MHAFCYHISGEIKLCVCDYVPRYVNQDTTTASAVTTSIAATTVDMTLLSTQPGFHRVMLC